MCSPITFLTFEPSSNRKLFKLEILTCLKIPSHYMIIKNTKDNVRRKARELGENIIKKGDEEIVGMVEEPVQLCGNNK